MATRQTSLFNFDAQPEEQPAKQPGVNESPEQSTTNEEINETATRQQSLPEPAERSSPAAEPEVIALDMVASEAGLLAETAVKPLQKKRGRGRMKLSDMNTAADLIDIPEDALLFQKSYYSIGTVSDMFRVNISLIRFWENEFDILKPKKNGKGDRYFRPEDVKNLKLIYHLLREKKYTIEGAKDFIRKNKKPDETFELIENLKKIKSFLNELKASL